VTRHYLPQMLEKKWGRIIFISSESGLQIPAEMVHYGMTKTAQLAVARGVAESFPASGVTVNSVLAGPTESEGVTAFVEGLARQQGKSKEDVERDFFQHARPSSLIKRFETPEEIAAMVVYLCSEAASATTGSSIRVDGGVVKSIA
jgi:NAD(P)-dependent dehydrogenase (short-subunit alcohol dehydrogenase family)